MSNPLLTSFCDAPPSTIGHSVSATKTWINHFDQLTRAAGIEAPPTTRYSTASFCRTPQFRSPRRRRTPRRCARVARLVPFRQRVGRQEAVRDDLAVGHRLTVLAEVARDVSTTCTNAATLSPRCRPPSFRRLPRSADAASGERSATCRSVMMLPPSRCQSARRLRAGSAAMRRRRDRRGAGGWALDRPAAVCKTSPIDDLPAIIAL